MLLTKLKLKIVTTFLFCAFFARPLAYAADASVMSEPEKRFYTGTKLSFVVSAIVIIWLMEKAKSTLSTPSEILSEVDKEQWNLSRYDANSAVAQDWLSQMRGTRFQSSANTVNFYPAIMSYAGAASNQIPAIVGYQVTSGIAGGLALIRLPFDALILPVVPHFVYVIYCALYGGLLGSAIQNSAAEPVLALRSTAIQLANSGAFVGMDHYQIIEGFQKFADIVTEAADYSYYTIPVPVGSWVASVVTVFSLAALARFVRDHWDAIDEALCCACYRLATWKEGQTPDQRRAQFAHAQRYSTRFAGGVSESWRRARDGSGRLQEMSNQFSRRFAQAFIPVAVPVPEEEAAADVEMATVQEDGEGAITRL